VIKIASGVLIPKLASFIFFFSVFISVPATCHDITEEHQNLVSI
jgi:hypothetical protein